MQNLRQKAPPDQWAVLRSLILDMRDAPDFETAQQRLDQIVRSFQATYPELCRCLTDDREASLNHLQVPHRHRRHVRTVNLVERSFVEQRRPHQGDPESLAGEITDQTGVRRADPAQ